MKKFVAMLLVLAMTASLLIGCTGGGNNSSKPAESSKAAESSKPAESSKAEESKAEEPTVEVVKTLTNWDGTTMDLPIVADGSVSFSQMQGIRDTDATTLSPDFWYVKKSEEDTGIHVDYTQVNMSDWNNQLNLMFASGEYLDTIMKSSGTVDSEMYGVDQGILIAVDDLLQYMPVYKARLDADTDSWKAIIKSDGKMYGIAKMSDDGTRLNGAWFINKTWLDTLGKAVPTTTDELLDALRAFVKDDPNGNGQNDEVGYEAVFDEMTTHIFNAWGIPENAKHIGIDDNGKVVFHPFNDDYRAGVEYLATMYAEGLMDTANVTQDSNAKIATYNKTWDANNEHSVCGFTTMHRLRSMGWDVLKNDLVWMPGIHAEGKSFKNQTGIGSAGEGFYITVADQVLPETAKWIDYQLCDQSMYECYYGPEGNIWNWNADHKCELGPAGDQGVMEFSLGVNGLYYLPAWYYNETFVQPDYRVERLEYNAYYKANGFQEKNPYGIIGALSLTPDASAEIAQIFANLETIYDQAVADMIMHGVDDAKWTSLVNELTAAGVERYLELYQGPVDDYLANN